MIKNMKKVLVLIGGLILMFTLFGCGKKYSVEYAGGKELYHGKSSYREGETVTLKLPMITDAYYVLYVDNERVDSDSANKEYIIFKFKMPAKDISVSYKIVGGYTIEDIDQLIISYSTGICGTPGYDHSTTYSIFKTGDKYTLKVESHSEDEGVSTDTKKEYSVDEDFVSNVLSIFDNYNLKDWEKDKNAAALDGGFDAISYLDEKTGKYISVDTGHYRESEKKVFSDVEHELLKGVVEENLKEY